VADARRFLAALATDPERIERGQPPALTIDGDAIALADLAFEPTTVAAEVLAEERD
jgi:hypothetical protein